ncbi:MAG: DPP IV N-terminal domain-containing protein [Flavobacteriaceae bacterium]|nr:DPP IV N-terminal domain-containing protein [Flavobacteriaceae bacterium]
MKKISIIFSILFLFQGYAQQKELSLNDAVLGYYKGLHPKQLSSLQWVSPTKYVYTEANTYIIKDVEKKTSEKITLANFEKAFPGTKRIPRISSIDNNTITFRKENTQYHFNYKTKTIASAIHFDSTAQNNDYNSTAKAIAYTINNNLYLATKNDPKTTITSFTDSNIVAGQAIARYEFGISKGTFWSPKGTHLAFYQKDETHVADYPLVDITRTPASLKSIKYPMAGQKSELAKIGVYNLTTQQTTYLNIDTSDEHYLTNLSWTPDGKHVLVAEVNRAQDHFDYNLYNVTTGNKVRTLFSESNGRWVEPENDAVFLPKSTTDFLWMSEKDGFKNIYQYTTSGEFIKQLTDFKFIVKSILGFDTSGKHVIISATGENPTEMHTYKVSLKSGKTTNLTPANGTHRTQLKGNYLIDTYSSLDTPGVTSIVNIKNGKETILNAAKNPLEGYKLGTTTLLKLKSKDGFDLHSRIIKPANFDPSKKYPVLVYVYGGTHAQLVTNTWLGGARLWMQWFAAQKDYIVFTLDNRGSANRGFAFESVIHRTAGDAGMEDQLIGVEYLKSLPYVDADRIAVHGWSYGGFMTSSLLLRHPKVFTTGVAGGPVTDWKFYEAMYGERYMDTPQENPEGYANSRIGKYIENLEGKLLLIHGSVDPTVVPQHSMEVLKEAVEKGVQLDFFTYPMHEHNVRGKDRVHLMQKVLDYVLEHNQ